MRTGRPKLKRGVARSVQIGVRFTPSEYKKILLASKLNGFGKGKLLDWIRFVALDYARSLNPDPFDKFRIIKSKAMRNPPDGFVGFGTERIRYIPKPG